MKTMNKVKSLKVIRVDDHEYELENGEVFQFPEPLEIVPPLGSFRKSMKNGVLF